MILDLTTASFPAPLGTKESPPKSPLMDHDSETISLRASFKGIELRRTALDVSGQKSPALAAPDALADPGKKTPTLEPDCIFVMTLPRRIASKTI